MTRWKASSLHLLLSVALFVLVAGLLLVSWRPREYLHATGAGDLLLVLAAVHLTLGPLLTLIVFRSGKRGLKFDLCVIGMVQIAALAYGVSVLSKSRPVFLVAVPDEFVLVSAAEVSDADLTAGQQERFRVRSWTGPSLVAAEMPNDPKEKSALAFSALSGRDLQNLPKYYRDYGNGAARLLANAKPLEQLRARHPEAQTLIADWLRRAGRADDSVKWLPLVARKNDLVMLIDVHTAEVLQPLPIDPW